MEKLIRINLNNSIFNSEWYVPYYTYKVYLDILRLIVLQVNWQSNFQRLYLKIIDVNLRLFFLTDFIRGNGYKGNRCSYLFVFLVNVNCTKLIPSVNLFVLFGNLSYLVYFADLHISLCHFVPNCILISDLVKAFFKPEYFQKQSGLHHNFGFIHEKCNLSIVGYFFFFFLDL